MSLPHHFDRPPSVPRAALRAELQLGPSLRPVRDLVRRVSLDVGLAGLRVEDLVLAVDELAANALEHGGPPAWVRAWTDRNTLVFEVVDCGPGLADPSVGLVAPSPGTIGGAGLWLARQLADRLEVVPSALGATVRLGMDV